MGLQGQPEGSTCRHRFRECRRRQAWADRVGNAVAAGGVDPGGRHCGIVVVPAMRPGVRGHRYRSIGKPGSSRDLVRDRPGIGQGAIRISSEARDSFNGRSGSGCLGRLDGKCSPSIAGPHALGGHIGTRSHCRAAGTTGSVDGVLARTPAKPPLRCHRWRLVRVGAIDRGGTARSLGMMTN
jgi:hypothetical protein